jgi:hypothetical protein
MHPQVQFMAEHGFNNPGGTGIIICIIFRSPQIEETTRPGLAGRAAVASLFHLH